MLIAELLLPLLFTFAPGWPQSCSCRPTAALGYASTLEHSPAARLSSFPQGLCKLQAAIAPATVAVTAAAASAAQLTSCLRLIDFTYILCYIRNSYSSTVSLANGNWIRSSRANASKALPSKCKWCANYACSVQPAPVNGLVAPDRTKNPRIGHPCVSEIYDPCSTYAN